MKIPDISKLLTVCLTAFFAASATGQTSPPAGPASSIMYEISGKKLPKPSYLFGTIHAACQGDVVSVEVVTPYIDRSERLLMEIDLDHPKELGSVASSVIIPNGKTLKDFLKPDEFAKVDAMVTELLGISAENVKSVKPMVISVLLLTSPKVLGCTPPVTYDSLLARIAADAKKPVEGLETAAQQIAMIDSKPIEKQARELYEMSLEPAKFKKNLTAVIEAYRNRDSERLFEYSLEQSRDDKEFLKRLLDDRNMAWIPKIEAAITARPTFIAVGAAHLGGKFGVVSLLRAKGYTVTAVKL